MKKDAKNDKFKLWVTSGLPAVSCMQSTIAVIHTLTKNIWYFDQYFHRSSVSELIKIFIDEFVDPLQRTGISCTVHWMFVWFTKLKRATRRAIGRGGRVANGGAANTKWNDDESPRLTHHLNSLAWCTQSAFKVVVTTIVHLDRGNARTLY